jgi:hypothetical protein
MTSYMWLSNAFAKIITEEVISYHTHVTKIITNNFISIYHSISPAAYFNKLSIFFN